MPLALIDAVDPTLDQILAELSEPTEELSVFDLEPIEEVELDDDEPFSEPMRQVWRRTHNQFVEPTVRVDMPWLRGQLW
jgi:hypothetical protein